MSHENRDAGKERLTYICFPLGKVLKLLLIFLLTQKWLFPYSTEPGSETTHRPPANSQKEKTLVLKHDECKPETLSVVSFFPLISFIHHDMSFHSFALSLSHSFQANNLRTAFITSLCLLKAWWSLCALSSQPSQDCTNYSFSDYISNLSNTLGVA